MKPNKITITYFSATDVTRTYAEKMKEVILERGWDVRLVDVTSYDSRHGKLCMQDDQNIIFGFPVYADFAPSVINEWIQTLDGSGKQCSMFFTYGGRTCGYAHFHTKLLLERAGFQVLLSAELLGRHSFNQGGWSILKDRPNKEDLQVGRNYAQVVMERFSMDDPPDFFIQKPFGYSYTLKARAARKSQTNRTRAQPTRMSDDCSMCRICEDECPTQAFDADSGLSDIEKCIECMRCVYLCPDDVIQCHSKMKDDFQKFLEYFHLNDEMLNAKQSKIIMGSWQAAA